MCRIVYICLFLSCFLFSCKQNDVCAGKAKSLDSISGAMQSVINSLQKVDTALLERAVTRFNHYKQFIRQNVNDTLSKHEADQLQIFVSAGTTLENFENNRKLLIARGSFANAQIQKLSEDLKKEVFETAQAVLLSKNEMAEAAKIIEAAHWELKSFHVAIEEFRTALSGVEQIIRSRNHGELPFIVKDNVSI